MLLWRNIFRNLEFFQFSSGKIGEVALNHSDVKLNFKFIIFNQSRLWYKEAFPGIFVMYIFVLEG